MAQETSAIEMFVGGLILDPNTQAPVVVLKDEAGEVCLPIWIGMAEATSIASALKQVTMARPLTHDLMNDVFTELGAKVQRVVITELRDSTYYAELVLSYGERAIILDSRPSDAIAIALRAAAPIYVMQQVLEQARVTFAEAAPPAEKAAEGQNAEGADQKEVKKPVHPDFKAIDKDKWNEILGSLNPEDFKYKT